MPRTDDKILVIRGIGYNNITVVFKREKFCAELFFIIKTKRSSKFGNNDNDNDSHCY